MASSCQKEECMIQKKKKIGEKGQGGVWVGVKGKKMGSGVEGQLATAGGCFLNSRVGLDS